MNLLEYEAKKILKSSGISTPKSFVIRGDDSYNEMLPTVLKSQVPTGGRGKAGGIKIVKTPEEFNQARDTLFARPIKSHLPKSLLAEELLDIDKEFYLAILVDRASMSIQIIAHKEGGMEVEDQTGFKRWEILSEKDAPAIGQSLADTYDLQDKAFLLQDLVKNLFQCFNQNDATLIEINPLVLTKQGSLVAGDAKMTLDDAAAFRHNWQFESPKAESSFVTINQTGNVATIANGAGLAMATVDAAYAIGLKPANFLDIGGGASEESLLKAFEKIMEYPNIEAIVVNIFAGITRSDEVARAIIAARTHIENLPPLYVRIAGTSFNKAESLLEEAQIHLYPTLNECLKSAKESIHG